MPIPTFKWGYEVFRDDDIWFVVRYDGLIQERMVANGMVGAP